jgi:hypothetical protein
MAGETMNTKLVALLALPLLLACQDAPLGPSAAEVRAPRLAGKPTSSVYRVSMANPGALAVRTDCSATDFVLAHPTQNGTLNANGTDIDATGQLGPDLFLNLMTNVNWTRKYDVGRGLSGVFNGCYGETPANPASGHQGYNGNLFLFFESSGGQPTVRFTWHFDYHLTAGNDIREHFTLHSGKIPFAAWTGGDVSGRVVGSFQLEYYLKEGKRIVSSYTPLPGGTDLPFEFDLTITRER